MIRNPIELRLAKLSDWQLKTFMACLCERMYPNYVLFCRQTAFAEPRKFRAILDLAWESLLVKSIKINFDSQLEKLEPLMPEIDDFDGYGAHAALDACEALSELLHANLNNEILHHARRISAISLKTISDVERRICDENTSDECLKNNLNIINELDIQWEIYRCLNNQKKMNLELIKGLKEELQETKISNLGVFLNN